MYWCETWIFSCSSTRWRGWEKLTGLAWEMAFFCSGIGWISAEVLLHSIMFQEGIGWDEFQVCDVTCLQILSTNNWAHQMQQEYEMSFFELTKGPPHTESAQSEINWDECWCEPWTCGWCQWQKCLQLAAASIPGSSTCQSKHKCTKGQVKPVDFTHSKSVI